MKLDLGCGPNKREGYIGVDCIAFPGVDVVTDLTKPWPWADNTVDEIVCSHMVEHLDAEERIHFVNEMSRVMKVGAKATIITPAPFSERALGDLSHKWPPVSSFWYFYLDANWRTAQAPHEQRYNCNFETTWGYVMHPELSTRNQEFQQFAVTFYKEAAQDIVATLTKRG